jgi:hypothetical protein
MPLVVCYWPAKDGSLMPYEPVDSPHGDEAHAHANFLPRRLRKAAYDTLKGQHCHLNIYVRAGLPGNQIFESLIFRSEAAELPSIHRSK